MRLLREACQRGVAGVVVTHDAQLASWADRIVFLRMDESSITHPRPGRSRCWPPVSTGDLRGQHQSAPAG
jgi:putative ABC transport system ATP-binding protein